MNSYAVGRREKGWEGGVTSWTILKPVSLRLEHGGLFSVRRSRWGSPRRRPHRADRGQGSAEAVFMSRSAGPGRPAGCDATLGTSGPGA